MILLMRKLGLPEQVPGFRLPVPHAVAFGMLLAVLVSASAAIALSWQEEHGYYFPIFVLVLAMPSPGTRISDRARSRVLGTAAGLLITLPLAIVPISPAAVVALIPIVLCACLVVHTPLWVNAALTTVLIVLAANPASGGVAAGETRLAAVFTAAVLVLTGAAIVMWLRRRNPRWFDPDNWALPAIEETDRSAAGTFQV